MKDAGRWSAAGGDSRERDALCAVTRRSSRAPPRAPPSENRTPRPPAPRLRGAHPGRAPRTVL